MKTVWNINIILSVLENFLAELILNELFAFIKAKNKNLFMLFMYIIYDAFEIDTILLTFNLK